MKANVAYLSLEFALNLPRFPNAAIPRSFETPAFWASAAYLIHSCFSAASADGLLSLSLVRSAEMKSFPVSEIEAQIGSEKENLPILTFFMIS